MAPGKDAEEDLPHFTDPYKVLGIETAATAEQVKSAYRKLALKHHPGKKNEVVHFFTKSGR